MALRIVVVCGSYCCMKPCWYVWRGWEVLLRTVLVSMVLVAQKSMLMTLAYPTTKVYDRVSGPCCGKGPSWCPWSVTSPETMLWSVHVLTLESIWMSMVHPVTRNHVRVHDLCYHWLWRTIKLLLQWYQLLRVEKERPRNFCDNTYPHLSPPKKSKAKTGNHQGELLKIVLRGAEV